MTARRSLHPNLGRVAAAYDDILARWASGTIDTATATARAATLVARDDQGVRWRIAADSGDWQREEADGRWVADVPPAAGYATLAAADLTGPVGASLRTVHRWQVAPVDERPVPVRFPRAAVVAAGVSTVAALAVPLLW